jgi:hypothetical protein
MSNAQSAPIELLLNGTEDHKAELAKLQMEQEMLKYTLAVQDKFETIRGEYVALRRLVYQIRDLKANEPSSQSQKNFVDDLIRHEESLDGLATSLTRFLD